MARCDKCLHGDVCFAVLDTSECKNFKDRSRFVELPCKVGDTLYIAISDRQIVLSAVVTEINISEVSLVIKAVEKITYTMLIFMLSDFGSTVFMAKEEAEQALAKRKSIQ